jgi:transcriptional regulator with XRE-family HTH domain
MSKDDNDIDDLQPDIEAAPSWFEQLAHYTGAVATGALSVAKFPAVLTEMFGESWLKDVLFKTVDTERLMAMVEAGRIFKDARQVAGLTVKDMADALGMSDESTIKAVEEGKAVLPFEMIFRSASLVARHDPVPFIIQLMRSYNPRWGKTLDKWGVSALPKQFERERRFINVYRKHDQLRQLTDDEYARLISYVDSATSLVLDVMNSEKAANMPPDQDEEQASS